jgi:hypothetical protein
VNIVQALNLVRLDVVGAVHPVQHGHDLLRQGDLLADGPVVVKEQNVGIDVEIARLNAPYEPADNLVEIGQTLSN